MRLATALALCGPLAAAEDAGVMKLLRFSDHGIHDALCMDGSSSGIYFAPATTQTDKYVLYLQGGGWCNDKASCQQRCGARIQGRCSGALASSAAWPPVATMAGLFSTSPAKTPLPGAPSSPPVSALTPDPVPHDGRKNRGLMWGLFGCR